MAAAYVALPAPATQVRHLAGFRAHDVGPAAYGTFSRSRGSFAGGAPHKATVIGGAVPLAATGLLARPGLGGSVGVGAEIPAARTALSRTFVATNGGYVARIYGRPINYRAADGSMQPIDDSLVATAGGFTNRADTQRVFLPDRLSGAARVADQRGNVSFQLLGASGAPAAVSGSSGSYSDVLPGLKVTYDVVPGALKEALVLSSASAPAVFRFALNLSPGLAPALDGAGNLRITDAMGQVIYTVPAATMSDATPQGKTVQAANAGRVAVALTRAGTGWVLALAPDPSYLRSTARTFPVVIDPTIDSNAAVDCQIVSQGNEQNSSYCPYNLTSVGAYQPGFSFRQTRTITQLPLGNAVPGDATVLSAQLKVHVWSPPAVPLTVSAYGLTHNFTSSATWNSFDGVTAWATPGSDHDPNPLSSATITNPGWTAFPMSALVQTWVDGSRANDGVVLAADASATNSTLLDGTGPYPTGRGSGDPYPPFLEVYYLPRLGEPRGATIDRTTLTDRMSLGVNVANGNLLVHNQDLAITGTGLDQTIDRTYNNLSPYNYAFGAGWTSTAGREPILSGQSDGIAIVQPDGSTPDFVVDGQGGFITPPGVDATLCSIATPSCPGLPAGAIYLLTYRNGVRQSFDQNANLIATTDQNTNKISYTASQQTFGALAGTTDTQGRTLAFTDVGVAITDIADTGYPGGRHTSYGYTAGALTGYTDAAGTPTAYGYDAQHNLTLITDPNGNITKLGYAPDATGRIASILRVTNPANGAGDTTTYSYPATPAAAFPGHPTGCPGGQDGTVPYSQTVKTDAKGNATYYCSDTHDRVYFAQDAMGNKRQSTYSSNDNVVKFNNPTGDTTTTSYDTTERACASAEPASSSTQNPATSHLDFVSIPAVGSDPCLHQAAAQTSTTHNPNYPDYAVDPQGNPDKLGYDAQSNLTSVLGNNGNGAGVTLNYNQSNGTLNWSRDGNNNQTNYGYFAPNDPNGHPGDLKTVTPPGPLGASSYTYDGVSRVHTYLDGKGQTTTYGYDKMDRLTEVDYQDGSSIKYTPDNDGNTVKVVDSVAGTSMYTPDPKNRIISEQLATGQNNGYGYDASDNLHTVTDTSGTTTYGYDADNHNISILEPNTSVPTTIAYDANDQPTCITHPHGVIVQNAYQKGGELTDTTALKPGATCATTPSGGNQLTDYTYTYTTGTNDTALRQTMTALGAAKTSYTYDYLNRLRTAISTSDSRTYTLDGAGNNTSRLINGTTTSMTYKAANQICWASNTITANHCAVPPAGATTYTFDNNGNELANSAGLSLAYNTRDQTTSITSGGSANPLGYLGGSQAALTTLGSTTILNNLLGVSGQTTNGATTYNTRDVNSNLLAARTPTGTDTYLQDGLGSIVGVTSPAGTSLNTATYDPYGQTTASTGTIPNSFSYASGLKTPGNLIKFGERYYDPAIGRWTQQDPIAQPDDLSSPYVYVDGDPINGTDPSGLCFILDCSVYHDIGHALSSAGNAFVGALGAMGQKIYDGYVWLTGTRFRIQYHPPHAGGPHQYPHLQFNYYRKGAKGSGREMRIPLGRDVRRK